MKKKYEKVPSRNRAFVQKLKNVKNIVLLVLLPTKRLQKTFMNMKKLVKFVAKSGCIHLQNVPLMYGFLEN